MVSIYLELVFVGRIGKIKEEQRLPFDILYGKDSFLTEQSDCFQPAAWGWSFLLPRRQSQSPPTVQHHQTPVPWAMSFVVHQCNCDHLLSMKWSFCFCVLASICRIKECVRGHLLPAFWLLQLCQASTGFKGLIIKVLILTISMIL